jgi:hypothetical protein
MLFAVVVATKTVTTAATGGHLICKESQKQML